MTPIATSTRTSRPVRGRLAVVLVGVVLVAVGCSTSPEKQARTKSSVPATSPSSRASGAGGTSGSSGAGSSGATGPGVTGPPAADVTPIATATGRQQASPIDKTLIPLRLDVLSLKRLSGSTVEVRFAITNEGDVPFSPSSLFSDTTRAEATYDVGGIALLDRPADKKYLSLFSTDGLCLCTGRLQSLEIKQGASVSMYADITAPPSSVSTVDLTLPGFPPVIGLTIR
ncbi:MAG: hypothetical protein HYX34_13365 [Actinobacteria bacterium]|nr:hypothetical protein [Actinomycetota bacterium]